MGKLLQVVPVRESDKAPSVKLSCEGRILGRLEVLGKDGRHKGFRVEDHEGFSVGYPSYDVPVPFVGEDFHQLVAVVVGMSKKSQLVGMCETFVGFHRQHDIQQKQEEEEEQQEEEQQQTYLQREWSSTQSSILVESSRQHDFGFLVFGHCRFRHNFGLFACFFIRGGGGGRRVGG